MNDDGVAMKYDLRKPCPHCPFRNDIKPYLTAERVQDIQDGLVRGDFACHETTVFDDDADDTVVTENSQHCAGALILKEKLGESSQLMRIAERLGMHDHRKLDMTSPVFDCFEDMIDAQEE